MAFEPEEREPDQPTVRTPWSHAESAPPPPPSEPAPDQGGWRPTLPPVRVEGDNQPVDGTGPTAAPPTPRARGWVWRLTIRIVPVLLILGGGAIWNAVNSADRGESGEITGEGTLTATDLRVGDCLDLPEESEFDDVRAKPCSEAHDAEIYHVSQLLLADWPGLPEVEAKADELCWRAFGPVVPDSLEEEIGYLFFTPTEEAWQQGDHDVQCLLARFDGAPMTASFAR